MATEREKAELDLCVCGHSRAYHFSGICSELDSNCCWQFRLSKPAVPGDGEPIKNRIAECLQVIQARVEYADTHGGCPPAVNSVHTDGKPEAIAQLMQLFASQAAAAQERAAIRARVEEVEYLMGCIVSQVPTFETNNARVWLAADATQWLFDKRLRELAAQPKEPKGKV